MDERARRPAEDPEAAPPAETAEPEPTIEHYRLVEQRERLDTNAAGYRLAREAVDDNLAQQRPFTELVMEAATTAKANDQGVRMNAQTAEELIETSFRIARRVREELTAPPPAPRPGGFEVLMGGLAKMVDSVFGGTGEDLMELATDKLKQLAAAAGAPAPPPAAGEGTPAAGAAPTRPSMQELAVISDQLPADVADTLTMGELRELSELLARLRGEGRAADVRQALDWLRAQRGAG